ncbi:MAG: endolytic transglycosylase MltG [Micrococcaceae bacterium]
MTTNDGLNNQNSSEDARFNQLLFNQKAAGTSKVPAPTSGYIEEVVIDESGNPLKIYSKDGINFVDAQGHAVDFADEVQQTQVSQQPRTSPSRRSQAPQNPAKPRRSTQKAPQNPAAQGKTLQQETPNNVVYERVTSKTEHDIHAPTRALPKVNLVNSAGQTTQTQTQANAENHLDTDTLTADRDDEFTLDETPFKEVIATNPKVHSRKFLYAGIGILVAAISGLLWIFLPHFFKQDPYYAEYPGPGSGTVSITVQKGATGNDIANALVQNGVIKAQGNFLNEYAADKNSASINPGEYDFKKGMKSSDALAVLTDPIKNAENSVSIAINSGYTQSDVFDALVKGMNYNKSDLEELAKKPTDFGLPSQAPNLEGYLAPHLYVFDKDTKPKDAIQQMVDRQKQILTEAGVTDANQQFKTLIMASLAQKEGTKDDYAKIVGILNNRLKPDNTESYGALQLDSTVGYGLGQINISTTDEQRADASNKYNTYANKGLPIGPIDSPSPDAINAAIHPEQTDYYYWVTVNPDTGETKFAKTLEEHNQYVEEFNQWCTANADKCQPADTTSSN